MVEKVTDVDTLAMVRQTARDVFAADPTVKQLAELGWYGLFTPEGDGGSGWRPVEACAVAEEAGAAHSPSSWTETALAASALSGGSSDDRVDAVLTGETSATFCCGRVTLDPAAALVSGVFPFSAGLPADIVVVSDREQALGAVIDGSTAVTVEGQADCLDTTRSFRRLLVDEVAARPVDGHHLKWLTAVAQLLSCADTVGALGGAIDVVTNHLVERQAFGSSLASQQVIQHRLVELAVLHTSARALTYRAAEAAERQTEAGLIDAAHVYLGSRAIPALEDCVQLSGGMGFTWEFPIHHALRRVTTNSLTVRTTRLSGDRLASARGW